MLGALRDHSHLLYRGTVAPDECSASLLNRPFEGEPEFWVVSTGTGYAFPVDDRRKFVYNITWKCPYLLDDLGEPM